MPTVDAQLKRQFRQTVYVAAVAASRNVRGEPSFGAAASRSARWESRRELVRNASGEQVTSDFWMACENAVGLLDRVWGPDDGNGTDATKARKPIKVEQCIDEKGNVSHYEVWL